ncbi:NAD(P)H-hydrate dehydratase [Latilactobacillus fragifolii]|uniref:NAD(P)H-hydrate dehydratase n=1 Tax=Latilactobacillus fragifolii TaxID=2814244 RepID=UPI001ABB6DAF|nr:NAD(P)H-hydrate dehydratase [Latilactobacillus fragifolii]
MQVITDATVRAVLKERPAISHKGDFGRILIIGGSQQYGGAAIMSAAAAVYAGAGLVSVASDLSILTALHTRLPEAMFIDYQQPFIQWRAIIQSADVLVVGPGLGLSPFAGQLLKNLLQTVHPKQTVIIDGSALTLIGREHIPLPNANLILTPHQMEWARLSNLSIDQQTVAANQAALTAYPNATLVLKKHHTVVYQHEQVQQLTIGGPSMATGGSGDTLTGIIAAFCGQFGTSYQTICAAVYTHSAIADELAKTQYVTLPSQIIQTLPHYMAKIAHQS